MNRTKIEWATHTWNPFTGCSKVSEGCQNCYAEALTTRMMLGYDFTPRYHPDRLAEIQNQDGPKIIFVCSMSDLFHESHNSMDIKSVLMAMIAQKHLNFVVLTKRPKRMHLELGLLPMSIGNEDLNHVYFGVSLENTTSIECIQRYETLIDVQDTFDINTVISFEPMLGAAKIFKPVDWVICGAETGRNSRYCDQSWVRSIRNQCIEAEIPFFFKTFGKKSMNKVDGKIWHQFPEKLDGIKYMGDI